MISPNERELLRLLTDRIATTVALPVESVDVHRPLEEYGMASRDFLELTGWLEELLDRPVPPTTVWRHPTLAALAAHLVGPDAPTAPVVAPQPVPPAAPTAVAVIGIGCRFPGGADSLAEFWHMLREGRDAITDMPAERWAEQAAADPRLSVLLRDVRMPGGYLDDIAGFDADHFGIGDDEARAMDPQQRLALEVGWEALERAGIPPRSLAGSRTAVVVGATQSEYGWLSGGAEAAGPYLTTGSALSIVANRLSYLLDLRGPSLAVDTACSSSLVAVHTACTMLSTRAADLALAGGVHLTVSPKVALNFARNGVMAPDGRSKTFDASADGYGPGEGAGFVVLKRLDDALRDGDPVLAVVRGGAVNQDGRSNGLMAPNPAAQEQLLREAFTQAGVGPATIGYVEAHGTGTALGDPIEAGALAAVLGGEREEPCLVGSVKTNIGHLQAASGIAGFIKAALCVRYGEIPPSLHFTTPNPLIPFDRIPLQVATRRTVWSPSSGPRRAGVSAFGFGGTSAHLVLEQPPGPGEAEDQQDDGPGVFVLSAATESALRSSAARLADHVQRHRPALADVGHTLALRRSHQELRAAIVADDHATLIRALRALAAGRPDEALTRGTARRTTGSADTVWVFSGYGSHWPGMAGDLLTDPAFHDVVAELEPVVREEAGFSLRQALASAEAPDTADLRVAQPLTFAMQLGLAARWRSAGLEPAAVVGHSMGEVAAAVVSGALTAVDGARVICRRAQLLAGLPDGCEMAVVDAEEGELGRLLDTAGLADRLGVVAVSGPRSTVLAGERTALQDLSEWLAAEGVTCHVIASGVAAHSPQVDPIVGPLREQLAELRPLQPHSRYYSPCADDPRDPGPLDAAYWARNLRHTVRFVDAVRAAVHDGLSTFVEIAPHPLLTRSVQDTLAALGVADSVVVPTMHRGTSAAQAVHRQLGALHCRGIDVPFHRIFPFGRLVDLPTTSWQHRTFWRAPGRPAALSRPASARSHPLLTEHVELPGARHLWQVPAARVTAPGVSEAWAGAAVSAATCWEMALTAAGELSGTPVSGLVLTAHARGDAPPPEQVRAYTLDLVDRADGTFSFSFEALTTDRTVSRAVAEGKVDPCAELTDAAPDLPALLRAHPRLVDDPGPVTGLLGSVRVPDPAVPSTETHQALARLHTLPDGPGAGISPAHVDACLRTLVAAGARPELPTTVQVRRLGDPATARLCQVQGPGGSRIRLLAADGAALFSVTAEDPRTGDPDGADARKKGPCTR